WNSERNQIVLNKQNGYQDAHEKLFTLEHLCGDQCNCRQKGSCISRVFVLKKHQAEPSSCDPQENGYPLPIEIKHEQDQAGDERDEQREKQLRAFECSNVEHECRQAKTVGIPFRH